MPFPTIPTRAADHLTEEHLCRLWASGALPPESLQVGGQRIQVIFPGERSGTGGPDFQGALIAYSDSRVQAGDIEVHLYSSGWHAHGHERNHSFNNVILHIVLEDDGAPCFRPDGMPIPALALARQLAGYAVDDVSHDMRTMIHLADEHADASHPRGLLTKMPSSPCRVDQTSTEIRGTIRTAGRERLEGKARLFEGQFAALGVEQTLFTGLLDAAGYRYHRQACRLLAERLPIERLFGIVRRYSRRQDEVALGIILGMAGLLKSDAAPQARAAWHQYKEYWPHAPLPSGAWKSRSVRPANRPETRLRGIAAIIARSSERGLASWLLETATSDELVRRLLVAPGETGGLSPIGRGRALVMAVNIVVPTRVALARSADQPEREKAAWNLVESLPSGEDSAPFRTIVGRLREEGIIFRALTALEAQGLLYLQETYCRRRACWACPLASPISQPRHASIPPST